MKRGNPKWTTPENQNTSLWFKISYRLLLYVFYTKQLFFPSRISDQFSKPNRALFSCAMYRGLSSFVHRVWCYPSADGLENR